MIKPQLFVFTTLHLNAKGELETVYYAEDVDSGGYPYWASRFSSAKMFAEKIDIADRIKTCTYMYEKISEIHCMEVQLVRC